MPVWIWGGVLGCALVAAVAGVRLGFALRHLQTAGSDTERSIYRWDTVVLIAAVAAFGMAAVALGLWGPR